MKFFFKLKLEIFLVLLVFLAIIGFFIYAKVITVRSAEFSERQAIASEQMVLEMQKLNQELKLIRMDSAQ